MRIRYFISGLLLLCFFGCKPPQKDFSDTDLHLIPKPQSLKLKKGSFTLDKNTTLFCASEFEIASDFLQNYLNTGLGFSLQNKSKADANIIIVKDSSQPKEGYGLEISEKQITIKASDASGAFYGVQTLRQLLPAELERTSSTPNQSFQLPQLSITDAPKFQYRGMHLDVGRHFFPKKFIKEYIANLALLKMNYFHWHLTEDQGWRIEILKYPNLTKHAAYRDETLIGHYNETPQQFDGKQYGGFYTQDDIKEIVAFAETQNITIIPEIEMPGHAQAAVSAYPELGCTGEQIPVATSWGVFENIFCPNEATFTFLENVLDEVIELFPGEYIHIGGDEAPKKQWEDCDHCQKLIKDLNLKDEHGLQSYFIKRMEAYINDKGKKIIGWDEILEGGLAPNATVMSWRGTQGGIAAAKEKHNVIMTPTSHAYFDYYQAENADEPIAIGGFLPLKKVYDFNPIPAELSPAEATYILGAQGNIWTEYMQTEDKVEYMAYPRMLAMSEVVWSGASENIDVDYSDFLARLEPFMDRLGALDINYANHLYEIEGSIIKKEGAVFYELKTPTVGKEIQYKINNSELINYEGLIPITENTSITAGVFKDGSKVGRSFEETIQFHKGLKATISLNVEPHKAYSAGGKQALINGVQGSDSRYGDKEWLGFWGDDLEIKIDFLKETEIKMITLRFYDANGQWIYAPEKVYLWTDLVDGRKVATSALVDKDTISNISTVRLIMPDTPKVITKNIKLEIPSYGLISDGLQGAGNKAWTFIDEIVIE
jgi:hexosaminidase